MNRGNLAVVTTESLPPLPMLIDRAVSALSNARTAAEVLEASEIAAIAYDAAKRAARIGKAKQAHDSLIAAAHRAQADALEIEARAKRRLADEYDAAQERGEVKSVGNPSIVPNGDNRPSAADIGLSRKEIQVAREIRDAEEADPGIVRRTLDEALESGEEPTRAKVKRAVKSRSGRTKAVRRPRGHQHKVEESQHDRDLRALMGVWESTCESARQEFLNIITQ